MTVLGIETSCDETAVALVSYEGGDFVVQKSFVTSQIKDHAKYGGVVPELAARKHMEILFPMLEEAGIPRDGAGIDAIAVTAGPGLVVALRVGVEAAKTLAYLWEKPLVAVNHLEGHLVSAWLGEEKPKFPVLALLVSGGHTELVLMHDFGDYEVLGATRDDAAGEAFDKVGKLLGLPYPGGPEISKLAEAGIPDSVRFTRPMLDQSNFDFSFSGLKTAVRLEVESGSHSAADIAASFQEAVVDTLVTKTMRAAEVVKPASIILCGGVSANNRLREELQSRSEIPVIIPDTKYATDNAVMIAAAGATRAECEQFSDPLTLKADPRLSLTR